MYTPFSLVTPGQLTIGVDAAAPLPLHTDPAHPPMVGFDIDLTQEVAKRLGLDVTYYSALWRDIIEGVEQQRVDLICSAATLTEERKQTLDFSRPYLAISLAVVTRPAPAIPSVAELAQQVIGVRIATSAEVFVRETIQASSVRLFDMNTEAYEALRAGQVDAVIDDSPIAGHFARQLGFSVMSGLSDTKADYGMLFKKGNDSLRQAIDAILIDMQRDGTFGLLHEKWLNSGR